MATTSFVDGSTLTASSWFNDVDTLAYNRLTSPSGTNTITGTGPASMTAYAAGQIFTFLPANTNTGATTLNITPSGASALGAKNVYANNAAMVGGEIRQNVPIMVWYDGTQFQLIASGAHVNLYAVPDSAFTLQDDVDRTKQLRFQLSGITTATTRTFTAPDADGTLPLLGLAQTFSALQTFSAGITLSGTASNIALGSNYISNGGTDAGLSFDGSNNATFSAGVTAAAGSFTTGAFSGNLSVNGALTTLKGANSSSGSKTVDFQDGSDLSLGYIRNDGAWFTGTAGAACPLNNTTANAANLVVGASGDLQKSTSSLRYKKNISDMTLVESKAISLGRRGFSYTSNCAADDSKTRFIGYGAEEIAVIDNRFVTFDADGAPNWVQYERFVVPHGIILDDHESRLNAIEQRLANLESA